MKIYDFPLKGRNHDEVIGYFFGIVNGLQMAQSDFKVYNATFGHI